jgi:hypothetical protein
MELQQQVFVLVTTELPENDRASETLQSTEDTALQKQPAASADNSTMQLKDIRMHRSFLAIKGTTFLLCCKESLLFLAQAASG